VLDHPVWDRADRLLDEALSLSPEVRAGWLRSACAGDAQLEEQVDGLIEACCSPDDRLVPAGALSGPLWHEIRRQIDGEMAAEILANGTRIGAYEILGVLASGGMGMVYRARHDLLGREVAIKALTQPYVSDSRGVERFEREARILARLSHPHIATVYDFLWAENKPFLIMEYVEGPTLRERIEKGPIPMWEALDIAQQVAMALEEAHRKGIVHRDLKPGNIAIGADGRIKVLDFGLAKAWNRRWGTAHGAVDDTVTQTGVMLGTPSYMSPEQIRGEEIDNRSDIWGFGCLVYEMFAGKRAFPGATTSDAVAAVLRDEVDLRLLVSRDGLEISDLVRRCLEKDPDRRFQDISQARVLLAKLRRSGGGAPSALHGVHTAWVPVVALGAVVVLIVFLAFALALRRHAPPRLQGAVQVTMDERREDFPVSLPGVGRSAYAAPEEAEPDGRRILAERGLPKQTSTDPGRGVAPSGLGKKQ